MSRGKTVLCSRDWADFDGYSLFPADFHYLWMLHNREPGHWVGYCAHTKALQRYLPVPYALRSEEYGIVQIFVRRCSIS